MQTMITAPGKLQANVTDSVRTHQLEASRVVCDAPGLDAIGPVECAYQSRVQLDGRQTGLNSCGPNSLNTAVNLSVVVSNDNCRTNNRRVSVL